VYGVSFWGNENILKLDSDGCTSQRKEREREKEREKERWLSDWLILGMRVFHLENSLMGNLKKFMLK
jgi:hypothetical protein